MNEIYALEPSHFIQSPAYDSLEEAIEMNAHNITEECPVMVYVQVVDRVTREVVIKREAMPAQAPKRRRGRPAKEPTIPEWMRNLSPSTRRKAPTIPGPNESGKPFGLLSVTIPDQPMPGGEWWVEAFSTEGGHPGRGDTLAEAAKRCTEHMGRDKFMASPDNEYKKKLMEAMNG